MPLIRDDFERRPARLGRRPARVFIDQEEDDTISELSFHDEQSCTLRTELTTPSSLHLYGFELSSLFYDRDQDSVRPASQLDRTYR